MGLGPRSFTSSTEGEEGREWDLDFWRGSHDTGITVLLPGTMGEIMGAQGTDVVAFVRLIAFAGRHLNFFCRHCAIWITFSPCCRFFSISRNLELFDPATRRLTAKCLSHLQLASSPHWSYASRPKAPPPRSEYLVVDASFLSMGYGNPAHAHERDLVVACYVSDPRLQTRISSSMTNIAHNKR